METRKTLQEIIHDVQGGTAAQAEGWQEHEYFWLDVNGDYRDEYGDLFDLEDWIGEYQDQKVFYLVQIPEDVPFQDIVKCEAKSEETENLATGTPEPGEQSKDSRNEKSLRENVEEHLRNSHEKVSNNENDLETIPSSERSETSKNENTTELTSPNLIEKEQSIRDEIKPPKTLVNVDTTRPTKNELEPKSTPPGSEENRPKVLENYSNRFETEVYNSISLLNDSAKLLMTGAQTLTGASKIDPETGEVLQRANDAQVDLAVKCLSQIPSLISAKTELLKLSKK